MPCEFGEHCGTDRINYKLALYVVFVEGKYCGSKKKKKKKRDTVTLLAQKSNNLIYMLVDTYFSASVCALIQAFSVFYKAAGEQKLSIITFYHVFYAKTNREGLTYSTGTPILKNVTTQKHSVF